MNSGDLTQPFKSFLGLHNETTDSDLPTMAALLSLASQSALKAMIMELRLAQLCKLQIFLSCFTSHLCLLLSQRRPGHFKLTVGQRQPSRPG